MELTSARPILPGREQVGGLSEPPPLQRWRQIAHNASKHRPWFSCFEQKFPNSFFGFSGGDFTIDSLKQPKEGGRNASTPTFPTWLGEPPTPLFAPLAMYGRPALLAEGTADMKCRRDRDALSRSSVSLSDP